MRIGFNPHKDKLETSSDYFHQIIVPVYIPNFEGYFKDSFKILQLCLESIFKTSHSQTFITIVNNGSCVEIKNYLDQLLIQKRIHELIHTQNIGKLNAILKGLYGSNFKLVTITDADVLFLNNWQKETYTVFENFPKAGVICPTPSSKSLRTYTSTIYWDLFFSNKLKFQPVKNPEALLKFAESIDYENFYNQFQLQKIFTVNAPNCKAVVGAGHFVSTYKTEIFNDINIRFSNYKLGGDSEGKFLDEPVVKLGLWRLSTYDNFAYHLGNVQEDWMDKQLNLLASEQNSYNFESNYFKKHSKISNFIVNKIFSKFILNKKIFKQFIVWKGLPKDAVNKYL
ncbi:MAG: glycosyltransferase family 2 protein [Flavobacterium sp.]|nr:glycosyltransferase family 2 protein [Flavobacterium sp.]